VLLVMRAVLSAVSILMAACLCTHTTSATSTATTDRAEVSANVITESLRGAGLVVDDAGHVKQPFWTVPAHVFGADGGDLQIYEFTTARAARDAAAQVSPTGGSIGATMMTWMAAPHFFQRDRVIVNYVGSSPRVLAELQKLMGTQFAGQ